jgi:hypothetical protein
MEPSFDYEIWYAFKGSGFPVQGYIVLILNIGVPLGALAVMKTRPAVHPVRDT